MSSKIFRISGLPLQTDIDTLQNALNLQQAGIRLKSLTVSPCCTDPTTKVAIVEFDPRPPSYLIDVITGVKTDHQIQMNEEHDLNIDMDFYGLTQLYATPHKTYITADIVAVTGIAGHAFGSWRGKGDLRRMWLQDFLRKDLPNCRTMIFGYDSKLDSPGTHEIEDYRDNLLTELKKARMSDEERNRPVIFIGHSFGGIIITQALVKAQDSGVDPVSDPDTYAIYKSAYATIFFGTPHRGFNVKSLTKLVDKRKSGERLSLLNSVQTGSEILKECLERFLTFADQLKVVSFYEMIKSQTPEKVDTRFVRIGPYELSVPKESALLNLCGVEVAVGVNKDHTQLVKFDNKQCSAYSDTIVYLKRFERDISPQKTAPLPQAWVDINRHYSQDTSGGFIAAYNAIESQDIDQLANLCNSDELNSRNINLRHDNGSTLLHMAMLMGGKSRVKMVEWLLSGGADWMARNKRRVTPLVQVAMTEPKDAVRELLPRWIDMKTLGKDQRGWSQLHVAAAYGNSHAVGVLINLGADIEARNDDMSTPLHEAIRSGSIYTVQVLLTSGADIGARNMNGMTALDLAAYHGRDDLARILLDNKADVTVTDNEKWTPLHTASSKGYDSLVTVLLQHKASIDAKDLQGQTPIYLTIKNGHRELSRKLLHEGASLSVSDSQGRTVLHYAAMTGDDYVTQILLENGADAMAADESGKTPLHCAVKSGHSGVGKVLLDLGKADVASVDRKKRTPLHHAARNGHSGSVKLLLQHDAPIESKDIQGSTPLLHAANSGHGATVKILLGGGADINARDEQGCSALHLSTKQGHLEVLIQLVDEGIKVDATDVNGQTALQIACEEENDRIIRELKKGEVSSSKNQIIRREVEAIEKKGLSRRGGMDIGKSFVDESEAEEDDISATVFYFLIPVLVVVTLFTG